MTAYQATRQSSSGRSAVVSVVIIMSVLLAVMVILPRAAAHSIHALLSGDVDNRLPDRYAVALAEDISPDDRGSGADCAIWNWNGGDTVDRRNPGHNCETANLPGGTPSRRIFRDTDAFAVTGASYVVDIHGSSRRIASGVFTKIHDYERARCALSDSGEVHCRVAYG